MIECCVMKKASTRGDICDKVVGTVGGARGARGPVGGVNSGDNSYDLEDAIGPKKRA